LLATFRSGFDRTASFEGSVEAVLAAFLATLKTGGYIVSFSVEDQAEARAAVLLYPHQKTMASHQRTRFVRCSIAVEGPFSYQRLLEPLTNRLGREMRLPAAHLYGRPFSYLAAMPALGQRTRLPELGDNQEWKG
jgi:hypothetical protein